MKLGAQKHFLDTSTRGVAPAPILSLPGGEGWSFSTTGVAREYKLGRCVGSHADNERVSPLSNVPIPMFHYIVFHGLLFVIVELDAANTICVYMRILILSVIR